MPMGGNVRHRYFTPWWIKIHKNKPMAQYFLLSFIISVFGGPVCCSGGTNVLPGWTGQKHVSLEKQLKKHHCFLSSSPLVL